MSRLCAGTGQVAPAEPDRAGCRFEEARDHPQRRRLAAAGGAEQRDEFARADRQRQVFQHFGLPVMGGEVFDV